MVYILEGYVLRTLHSVIDLCLYVLSLISLLMLEVSSSSLLRFVECDKGQVKYIQLTSHVEDRFEAETKSANLERIVSFFTCID